MTSEQQQKLTSAIVLLATAKDGLTNREVSQCLDYARTLLTELLISMNRVTTE